MKILKRGVSGMDDPKDQANDDKGKVVEFPLHKVRKPKPTNPESKPNEAPQTPLQKKRALVVSLLSVVAVATFLSYQLGPHRLWSVSRSIQSVDDRPDLHHDIRMAAKLNHESLREPSSVGLAPTAEDRLRHEELNDSYAIEYSPEGALRSITFSPDSGGSPLNISSRREFVTENKNLIRIPFYDVSRPQVFRRDNSIYELYDLLDDDSHSIGHVYFTLAPDGSMLSMKVEPKKAKQ